MLLYDNATYMQVLEGSVEDVNDIYDSILKDSRNTGNVTLVKEEISQRDFPNWSMGFRNLKSCSSKVKVGYQDIFNGKLDKEIVVNNSSRALRLLMAFAKTE